MPFSQRNIFYLRTSAHVVLQTILYLDPRDLKWMNSYAHTDQGGRDDIEDNDDENFEAYEMEQSTGDLVWSRALSRLRYKIMPKLVSESIEGEYLSSTNKKEKVDVHIEPDFQMAYFFRKVSGKHAVLLKQKDLKFPETATRAAIPTDMPPPALPASAMNRTNAKDMMPASRLAQRQSNQVDNVVSQGTRIANDDVVTGEEEVKPVNRKRSRNEAEGDTNGFKMSSFAEPIRVKEEDEDVQLLDDNSFQTVDEVPLEAASIDVDAMVDDKKPRLHVNYSGFKIFGKCFIVVIEPTKRTKRLRPSLFQVSAPKERHQLSATPVPRQSRETPIPSSSLAKRGSSSRRSMSAARQEEEEEELELERQDSRRDRLNAGLFRGGSSSDWTPTPTPEPERRSEPMRQPEPIRPTADNDDLTIEENDPDESTSVMLATQMLQGGIAGQGNDIDDD